jgi:hypothetical protein
MCHSEGAPREPVRITIPGARPRNLLSVSSWRVATPRTSPVRRLRRRTRGAGCRVYPPAGREQIPRPCDLRCIPPVTVWPGLGMTDSAFYAPHLSFRGSAARTRPHHHTRGATEESTVRFLVACRDARTSPVRRLRYRMSRAGCRVYPRAGREQIPRPCKLRRIPLMAVRAGLGMTDPALHEQLGGARRTVVCHTAGQGLDGW